MAKPAEKIKETSNDYLFSMSHAPRIDEESSLLQMIPIIVFSSFIILIVRMYTYTRPMGQFFWTNQTDTTQIVDFFSYYKMIFVLICAAIALLVLLFKITTQTLVIKRSSAYIPMIVYSLFVLLSYIFSDYKEFAWFGYNDRFEGTLPLLAYMLLLFFVINSVNSEKNIKMVLYPLISSSVLLSILGISQATDHDFFQTTIGQKLIVPNVAMESGLTTWQAIDAAAAQGKKYLNFTFQNKEIYQTVYNINYVSFYLTLLIPLFGMLFILSINKGAEEKLWKKIGWGALFALTIYNLIGSASSGGFLGMGVVGIMGLIILNKKLIKWIKPLVILFVITGIVMGITSARWIPELSSAIKGATARPTERTEENLNNQAEAGSIKANIDYFVTGENTIEISLNGNLLTLQVTNDAAGKVDGVILLDDSERMIPLLPIENKSGTFSIEDDRFKSFVTLSYAHDGEKYYILLNTAGTEWTFRVDLDGIVCYNQLNRTVDLHKVAWIGFENNLNFGTNRGYIWSRTFPLLKNSLLIGAGADTYCLEFPQEDYAGKYNTGWNQSMIIDKPHNMYLHVGAGTGGISLLALLALYGFYLMQSTKLYRKSKFQDDFLTFAGAGIFFGIAGFLVTGLVDDSSVSVMPMFYTLLGMGVAVNMMLERRSEEI